MFNNCTMMGRIVNDPEIRVTTGGVAFCSFRIAVDRQYKAKDEERKTDFFNVVAWRKLAEFVVKYFSKGRMILISGELQTRQYTDKNGNPATWYEIIADKVKFTGEKAKTEQTEPSANSETQTENKPETPQDAPPIGEPPDADDYPF